MDLTVCAIAFGDNDLGLCAWCGGPLPKRRRRWCSDDHAHAWARNHVWTVARQAALERDGFACTLCPQPVPLLQPEVHHRQPVKDKGGYRAGCQHHQANLVTLCHEHHLGEDGFRRRVERVLADSGHVYVTAQLALPGLAA